MSIEQERNYKDEDGLRLSEVFEEGKFLETLENYTSRDFAGATELREKLATAVAEKKQKRDKQKEQLETYKQRNQKKNLASQYSQLSEKYVRAPEGDRENNLDQRASGLPVQSTHRKTIDSVNSANEANKKPEKQDFEDFIEAFQSGEPSDPDFVKRGLVNSKWSRNSNGETVEPTHSDYTYSSAVHKAPAELKRKMADAMEAVNAKYERELHKQIALELRDREVEPGGKPLLYRYYSERFLKLTFPHLLDALVEKAAYQLRMIQKFSDSIEAAYDSIKAFETIETIWLDETVSKDLEQYVCQQIEDLDELTPRKSKRLHNELKLSLLKR